MSKREAAAKMYVSILILILGYLHGENRAAAMECNTHYNQSSGRINAFNDGNTSSVTQCKYKISTSKNQSSWVRLRWETFDIDGGKMPDCEGGSVEVYTGCTSQRKVATFCSKNLRSKPHDIYSPDNCIDITFDNSNGSSRGFIASWKSYSHSRIAQFPMSCSFSFQTQLMTTKSVVLGSPGWPSEYNDRRCEWIFRTGYSGLRYVYNIMDMDMYKSSRGCRTTYSDNVYIRGEESLITDQQKEWYYCRYRNGDANKFDTQYYIIHIRMDIHHQKSSDGYRGFVIGLVAYEDDNLTFHALLRAAGGGIVVSIIVIVIATCCYRRCRRRQSTEHQPLIPKPQPQAASVAPLPQQGSYPQEQFAGYTQPPGGYPQQVNAPADEYAPPPPAGYPYPPPVYSEKPPEYQPPPYEPLQGATESLYQPPPAAGAGGYPLALYQPQSGYPTQ